MANTDRGEYALHLLELKNIKYVMDDKIILNGISLQIDAGDIIGVLGSSGAGKTSLFKIINLLQSPTHGTIYYQGKDSLTYPPALLRREIGYVFQKAHLFGNSVKENLTYPYKLLQRSPNYQEIADYLNRANLPEYIIMKKPEELSGGEQQRIALIRSLLIKPKILLLDEVTASLDEKNTLIIEKMICDQNRDRNATIMLISHNIDQAKRLANKILYLEKGKVLYFGSKDNYFIAKE